MRYSAYKLNKQVTIHCLVCTPFPILSQSVVPCLVLTVASWPTYRFLRRQLRWSGTPNSLSIFQFAVIHTVNGEGNGNPLQYSCLENSMDRGTWWAIVHGVAKSWPWLNTSANTVKGFSIVYEEVASVFLKFPCFFHDPTDIGTLISGSSAFSKYSLYIWKLSIHMLLKPNLKDFEHKLASIWNKSNCTVLWTFFSMSLLWDWKVCDVMLLKS